MQSLLASLSREPIDPLFAFLASPLSNALKIAAVIALVSLLLIAPFSLIIRLLQDSAIALKHRNPDNHISYWMIFAPLLLLAAAATAYYYHKATKLRTIASMCPLLESAGMALSLVAAASKLEVQTHKQTPKSLSNPRTKP
jgi:hypothetical protein